MTSKEAVVTSAAPAPLPFFSQAIKSGGFVFCSGSIGVDVTGAFAQGDIGARTAQALKNLSAVLDTAGSSIDEVVKVNIFITDMSNFGAVNAVYEKVFTKDPKPARTCVAVHQLPLGTDVEIECTAALLGTSKL